MDGHLIKQWAEQIPGTWDGTERAIQCPYHDDKNPSCSINIEKKVFYCHACGEKGTLKQLAARLGIDYPGNGQKVIAQKSVVFFNLFANPFAFQRKS